MCIGKINTTKYSNKKSYCDLHIFRIKRMCHMLLQADMYNKGKTRITRKICKEGTRVAG
jgi:hypothetical protein